MGLCWFATARAINVARSGWTAGDGHTGAEHYSGPLKNQSPNSGKAWLYFDTRTCKYQAEAGFTVKTTFTGDEAVRPSASVTGLAYGNQRHTPPSLMFCPCTETGSKSRGAALRWRDAGFLSLVCGLPSFRVRGHSGRPLA